MSKNARGRMATVDARDGHNVTSLIDELKVMINGNYRDFTTAGRYREYIHVTRQADGWYRAIHVKDGDKILTDSTTRLAQFIMNRVR